MLCFHSRMKVVPPCVLTYRDGVISSGLDETQWMTVRSTPSSWTCVVADDLHILRKTLDEIPMEYNSPVDCNVTVGSEIESTQKIRVSGRISVKIYWQHHGDVHITVESGAVVYFHAYSRDIRLLPNIRDHGRLFVIGRLADVLPTMDATSSIDMTRLVCATDIHFGFSMKLTQRPVETTRQRYVRTSISFPHAKADCRAVDDDTPPDKECKTCYKRVTNAVFSPCGHVYMCLVCAERHRRVAETNFCCPLCRTPITHVTKD